MKHVQSVLIRSTPGGFEPRFKKAAEFLAKIDSEVNLITWSRTVKDAVFVEGKVENVFKMQTSYGRGWKNVLSHLRFFLFIFHRLRVLRPKIIYACDMDTLLPSIIWGMNKSVYIVFDQFDPFSSRVDNRFLASLIWKMENYLALKSDVRITANMQRIPQQDRNDWFELKNIFKINSVDRTLERENLPFRLFYGGVLGSDRGLLACAAAVSLDSNWELHLYGQGPVSHLLANYKYKNVFLHDPVPHEELMGIASNSDLFLAMYDPARDHNKYTASNKLFEAAQLGIPLLTAKNTNLGEVVEVNSLGWSVDYNDVKGMSSVLAEVRTMSRVKKLETQQRLEDFFRREILETQETTDRILSKLVNEMEG